LASGVAGLAAGGYGVALIVQSGGHNLLAAAYWLAGGVIAHDAALAPATIAVVALAVRTLPRWTRAAAAFAMIVLGSLTLLAVPVLWRFGATPRNPTLLDRDYRAGWLVVAGVTLLTAAGVALARRRADMHRAGASRAGAEEVSP
jgi:hypothetical protein